MSEKINKILVYPPEVFVNNRFDFANMSTFELYMLYNFDPILVMKASMGGRL